MVVLLLKTFSESWSMTWLRLSYIRYLKFNITPKVIFQTLAEIESEIDGQNFHHYQFWMHGLLIGSEPANFTEVADHRSLFGGPPGQRHKGHQHARQLKDLQPVAVSTFGPARTGHGSDGSVVTWGKGAAPGEVSDDIEIYSWNHHGILMTMANHGYPWLMNPHCCHDWHFMLWLMQWLKAFDGTWMAYWWNDNCSVMYGKKMKIAMITTGMLTISIDDNNRDDKPISAYISFGYDDHPWLMT